MRKNEKRNGKALLPIVVFVVLYLGLGILFEGCSKAVYRRYFRSVRR